jgi:hypothetical protein
MKIVAQNDDRFLLDVGNDQGQVLDREEGLLFPPMYLESIVARGYWEPYEGDQAVLTEWLKDIQTVKEGTDAD